MVQQNAHLTFKGNLQSGRHGWLRLTPAYSLKLVQATLDDVESHCRILDPFSGTGTTGLYAAQRGLSAKLVDVNPFLIWFARAKTRNYSAHDISTAQTFLDDILLRAPSHLEDESLWQPPMFKIERWWAPQHLKALKGLRAALDNCPTQSAASDLLLIAFCRTLIAVSNAAFNHQSMSFKTDSGTEPLWHPEDTSAFERFAVEANHVITTAQEPVLGSVQTELDDSRTLKWIEDDEVDLIYTSPPYANRMSYIRELRPYMYWLKFFERAENFGELDWQAIGGTWGIATSRLTKWNSGVELPIGPSFAKVISRIRDSQHKNGTLLSIYLQKYFYDMWLHFQAARRVLKKDGRAVYIVGNSTFFNILVPTEEWYAALMRNVGFKDVRIEVVRKRNSKKELFEYSVAGVAG
jgi:DNA modification methylase